MQISEISHPDYALDEVYIALTIEWYVLFAPFVVALVLFCSFSFNHVFRFGFVFFFFFCYCAQSILKLIVRFVFLALALYLDMVLPIGPGSKKSPFFIFTWPADVF
jgi:hypothetical protein